MQQGLDAQTASAVISALEGEIFKQKKERARKDIMIGGGICIIGLAITLISYTMASSGSGTYVVTWGAVILGRCSFSRACLAGNAKRSLDTQAYNICRELQKIFPHFLIENNVEW